MTNYKTTYRPIALFNSRCTRVLIALCVMLFGLLRPATAQQQIIPVYDETGGLGCVVVVDSIRLSKGDSSVSPSADTTLGLTLTLGLADNALPKTDMVTLTPRLFTATDSIDFPALRLYGSWAYIALQRKGDYSGITYSNTTGEPIGLYLPASEARTPLPYSQHIAFEPWMEQAQLKLLVSQTDGCGTEYLQNARVIGEQHMVLSQREIYKQTAAQVSHLQGRAYINFAVNKTDIRPELGRNREELEALNGVLDSLRQVENMQIRHIYLKGYASPEGSYKHNDELSRGRVESLRQYLADHYDVNPALISTENEPEDWEGLRDYVSKSDLADREQILKIIDSQDDPDKKLKLIVDRHADAYKQLLKVVFPLLRHTDYRIDYTITDGQDTEYTEIANDTSYINSVTLYAEELQPAFNYAPKTFTPLLALKTNMLYDLILAPNIEVEIPFGRDKRWSVMAEYLNPWWRLDKLNYAYEIQEAGLELRRWLMPRCDGSRPWLSGLFLGAYLASAKYDLEYNGVGDQGEIWSLGATVGYSWPIARRWNLELSGSLGFMNGERRHYNAEFESSHLIYKETKNLSYFGPTKLKFSLIWIIPSKEKGGAR